MGRTDWPIKTKTSKVVPKEPSPTSYIHDWNGVARGIKMFSQLSDKISMLSGITEIFVSLMILVAIFFLYSCLHCSDIS